MKRKIYLNKTKTTIFYKEQCVLNLFLFPLAFRTKWQRMKFRFSASYFTEFIV